MKNISIVLCFCYFLSACIFVGLNEDLKQLNAAVSISGKVSGTDGDVPIVVTLSRPENGEYPLQAYTVIYGNDDFLLTVPTGDYYLLAFEDANQDFTLQENERVAWYGSPTLLSATTSKDYSNITINLRSAEQVKNELPSLFVSGKPHQKVELSTSKLGTLVDTSVFKQEYGPLGMWDPVKFHQQGHSGIYFLEPYDKNKIPVLFVHGISGSGYDWLYLLENLDRDYFQPWVVQYPSGMRLGLLSKSLNQSVDELKALYHFDRLAVVAHSMGGLVSRGFINHRLSANREFDIAGFITISTPWLGHSAANQGAKYAPVAVPSWFDMVPGSPYLASLHRDSLPGDMEYYLLFGHKGEGASIFSGANTDGTVTIRSQLSMKAQAEAVKVIGYDEDHISILNNPAVATKLNEILQRSLKP